MIFDNLLRFNALLVALLLRYYFNYFLIYLFNDLIIYLFY
jgi:hypothetical protein